MHTFCLVDRSFIQFCARASRQVCALIRVSVPPGAYKEMMFTLVAAARRSRIAVKPHTNSEHNAGAMKTTSARQYNSRGVTSYKPGVAIPK